MKLLEHESVSVSVYMYRWGRALYWSSGIWPKNERHPHVIKDFISSLKKNIRNKITNRWAEMWQPSSNVDKAFKLACDIEKQLQVAYSFKLELPNYPTSELNELSAEESSGDEIELNKMSRGKRWGNNNRYNQKCSSFSKNRNNSNRPQQNNPQDSQQGKQWGQRLKDSKITLTQESAHYVLTELSSSFFKQIDLAMKLKWEELRKKERSSNQVNEITEGDLIQAFGVIEDQMEKVATVLSRNKKTEKSGNSSAWLAKNYKDEDIGNSMVEKEVFFINTGNTKGTTFKIKVKDLIFSSRFNTGTQVSCIKYDTITEMGLLHQISNSSTCIRTANSQDVGVRGSVVVNFKIGPCSFTHKFIVCRGITRPFILGEEFLSCHCFKLGWTDDNKRFNEYRNEVIAVASQAVMDDRIMVSLTVRIPARHFVMVPKKCPNMFSGRVEAHRCHEFKAKFSNLYLKPMQYNNPDCKWQEEIPYMIINL